MALGLGEEGKVVDEIFFANISAIQKINVFDKIPYVRIAIIDLFLQLVLGSFEEMNAAESVAQSEIIQFIKRREMSLNMNAFNGAGDCQLVNSFQCIK